MKTLHQLSRFKISGALTFLILIAATASAAAEGLLTGSTMGTTYHIKIVSPPAAELETLQAKIDQRLLDINRSMSTYLKESELNRFNAIADTRTALAISADFKRVIDISAFLHRETNGAWDGTVNPLIKLWDFKHKRQPSAIPEVAQIRETMRQVGFHEIEITEDRIRKKNPAVALDLASVAKGDAVDQVAFLLKANGYMNFSVEIGGEVFVSGLKANGQKWRIGINTPDKDAPVDQVYAVVALSNRALATSGDYRHYIEHQGKTYSHIIDPKTGYPVSNGVVSASVLADNCAMADGLATALMVMGPEAGLQLVERLPQIECLIIVRRNDGQLINHLSSGFPL